MQEAQATAEDLRSWRRGDGRVRKRLLRRIAQGNICGVITVEGRPCLAARASKNGPCERHTDKVGHTPDGVGPQVFSGAKASERTLLWHLFGAHLPPEQQALLSTIKDAPADTLEAEIAQVRLRLILHVKRHTAGRTTVDEFERRCRECNAELRQLQEAHMRLQLAAIELRKAGTTGINGQDAFDPAADLAPWERPGWTPGGEGG